MQHLIICPEYPPAPIPAGGIGTYVSHISRLLAEAGETVHVVGWLWEGAPQQQEVLCDGRLIIHRISVNEPLPAAGAAYCDIEQAKQQLQGLLSTSCGFQCFSWQAALFVEALIQDTDIDVIESQDYQAPLYYFLLRRALGLGPKHHPPCILHLHSPTDFIASNTEWDISSPHLLNARRFEEYCVGAADALLCPSHYLASHLTKQYGMQEGSIHIIRLPMADHAFIERDQSIWENGTICCVGRLQEHKGSLEWIDAAVAVAPDYPEARFEFIGPNMLGSAKVSRTRLLNQRIPEHLRHRFLFRGEQHRSALPSFLAHARMAVIPSRIENFPNTCIEAMSSGLPVIGSGQGGMVEMVKDNQTGWFASEPGSAGLAGALRRALEMPPIELAAMGFRASQEIRKLCDNQKILESHLELRARVRSGGVVRSSHFPVNLPWAKRSLSNVNGSRKAANNSSEGIALVVTCLHAESLLPDCIESLARQTHAPATVVVVIERSRAGRAHQALLQAQRLGCKVQQITNGTLASAKNSGIDAVFAMGLEPLALAFFEPGDRCHPDFVKVCESIFLRCPEVGVVSSWTQHLGDGVRFEVNPCPAFPFQLLKDDAAPTSAIRTEALREAGFFRAEMEAGYENWDLVNTVMAAGWVAVTYPHVLSQRKVSSDTEKTLLAVNHKRNRQQILQRNPELIVRDAGELIYLLESRLTSIDPNMFSREIAVVSKRSQILRPSDIFRLTLSQQLALSVAALRRPKHAIQFVLRHTKTAFKHSIFGQKLSHLIGKHQHGD